MGELMMDAAYANARLRQAISDEIHLVKWALPFVKKDENGKYCDVDVGPGICTLSRFAIEIFCEHDGKITKENIQGAIDEYMRRRGIKPYTDKVIVDI